MAKHFAAYFQSIGIQFNCWSRRKSKFPALEGNRLESLAKAVRRSSHVLLLISDSEIETFIEGHKEEWTGKILVHFSGCHVSSRAEGAHPLYPFTEEIYDLECYKKIPFILEKCRLSFQEILPGLPNPSFSIEPELKPYYHSLCVMAGNFPTLLWSKLFSEFEARLDLPISSAFPYLDRITENLKREEVSPLTGPLARRDQKTIQENLKALEGDAFLSVYKGFLEAFGMRKLVSGEPE